MFGKTQIKNSPIYYPLLASEEINGGVMSKAEVQDVWSRFGTLSVNTRDVLTSEELPLKLKALQEKLGSDDTITESLSVLIRWYFFEDIDGEGLRTSLNTVVGEKADEVFKYIQKEILTIKPQPKVEEVPEEEVLKHVATTVRLPLLQALSKYEQLGNQLITEERLKLKSQAETVRPSLLYWIKYYRDELGVGHHSSVDRGNFLFRSENGKKLTPEERERVNLVLRSVEENIPLDIDTEQSIILFPAFVPPAPAPVRQSVPPMAPQRPAFQPSGSAVFQPAPPVQPGAMSFSSKHVLPAERAASEVSVSTPTPRPVVTPTPATPATPATPVAPKRNPFHIRPVSMGKEE